MMKYLSADKISILIDLLNNSDNNVCLLNYLFSHYDIWFHHRNIWMNCNKYVSGAYVSDNNIWCMKKFNSFLVELIVCICPSVVSLVNSLHCRAQIAKRERTFLDQQACCPQYQPKYLTLVRSLHLKGYSTFPVTFLIHYKFSN